MSATVKDVKEIWTIPADSGQSSKDLRTKLSLTPTLAQNYGDLYTAVYQWPRKTDKFLFMFGFAMNTCSTAISSIVVSRVIKQRFFMSHRGIAAVSAFGATAFATALTTITTENIGRSMIANDGSKVCLVCKQLQQSIANVSFGVVGPIALVTLDTLFHAARDVKNPMPIPPIYDVRRLYRLLAMKLNGPTMRTFGWLAMVNITVGCVATYLEMKALTNIAILLDDDPSLLPSPYSDSGHDVSLFQRMWYKITKAAQSG